MEHSSLAWWAKAVVYQIYPRSFVDSNGDGIGDLRGVIDKLDYLVDLGVDALWLSPFFSSPQADFGYDISNFRGVATEYGTMSDVDELIETAHRKGLNIVLDMVLNHTSDQHPWFIESRSSRENPKRDWYIWRDGRKPKGRSAPNNWCSMIGSRGWHYDPRTEQWYWAQFLPCQPDLNYRNTEVRKEMFDTLRFWMAKGVDGFRLDIINALFEDAEFRDNPVAWKPIPSMHDPSLPFHSNERTLNHPDTLSFMRELRDVVDNFGDGRDRFLVGEAIAPLDRLPEFCGDAADGLNLVFMFESLSVSLDARRLRRLIERYEERFPEPFLPTLVFSNHDRPRRISRLGGDLEKAKLNAAFQLTARGVPFLYYGEEVGIEQEPIPLKQALDPIALRFRHVPQPVVNLIRRVAGESLNRDECRTPMQWDASITAGFCAEDAEPWLPLSASYRQRNVTEQTRDPESLLNCYKRFISLRRKFPALHAGTVEVLDDNVAHFDILGYQRKRVIQGSEECVLVFLNTSAENREIRSGIEGFSRVASTIAQHSEDGAMLREGFLLHPWECSVFATRSARCEE